MSATISPGNIPSSLPEGIGNINLFKSLADSVKDFIAICSIIGEPLYINPAGLAKVGLTQEDFYVCCRATFFPEDLQYIEHEFLPSVLRDGSNEIEIRFRHFKTKAAIWMSYHVTLLRHENGTPFGLATISKDITGQRRSMVELEGQVNQRTEQLQHSRDELEDYADRLVAVFNQAKSGMFTFAPVRDENGDIVDFRFVITNPSFASYVGQTPEILNGEPGSKWFPGYLHNGVFDMYKSTFLTGKTQNQEIHYHVDGHDLYLDLISSKIGDEVLVTFTDFTPLRKAQLDLERSVLELTRSNANLEEFAYAASHDLKEPVRKILFFCDRLRASLSQRLSEEESGFFERMTKATQRMGLLIDDLLTYSQVRANDSLQENVDLNQKMALVLDDLEMKIKEKSAVIELARLPVIYGHRRQLQQLFHNLVMNSLNYSKPNEPPRIVIQCTRITGAMSELKLKPHDNAQEFFKISITDNGIGFEQQYAEKIFHVFTRLHENTEYKGTGIGLSIVRKVIENHDGYITAQGEPGVGATFNIFIPCRRSRAE